ncbi:MAG: hypothetical protein N3D85_01765 [Candidatus Bathyarchaeota archaeon]|nr:hypothetical protein [Candidatus Bathyarchaeota archaeon]
MKNNLNVQVRKGRNEGLISAIVVGAVFILIGVIFVINSGLSEKIASFFKDITFVTYPLDNATSILLLPAPANPQSHAVFYNALMQFALGIGVIQVLILALRLTFKSTTGKMAETVGNMVFWFGVATLINYILQAGTKESWFHFWGAFIIVIGFSLIARALVHLVKR